MPRSLRASAGGSPLDQPCASRARCAVLGAEYYSNRNTFGALLLTAVQYSAKLVWRSPPRLRRCRTTCPKEAGIGATPSSSHAPNKVTVFGLRAVRRRPPEPADGSISRHHGPLDFPKPKNAGRIGRRVRSRQEGTMQTTPTVERRTKTRRRGRA